MQLFPLFLFVSSQVVLAPTVKDLSETAVASRKGIHSYHIVAKSRTFTMGESEATNIAVESTYEIWSRGDKMRTDRTITKSSNQPENVDHRRINCRNCERDGYALHTNQGLKRLVGVMFYIIDNKYDMDDSCRIDWTVFGLRNTHSQGYTKGRVDEGMLAMSKHKNLKIEPVTIQSQQLVTVSGDGGPGTLAQIWFAPEYSGNPVRFLMKLDVLTRETLVEYQKVDGYWYPKSTHHINKQGDKISDEEQLTFELVELNRDIPDAVFTFAGLNLLSGTPINLPEIADPGKQPWWKDGKVDSSYLQKQRAQDVYEAIMEKQQVAPIPDQPAPGLISGRWIYFVVAGLFAVAGLFIVRKLRKSSGA